MGATIVEGRPPRASGASLGWLTPVVLLPVLILAPEVVNIGFMYLRWDHLLLIGLVLVLLGTVALSPQQGLWRLSPAGVCVLAGFVFFSLYQLAMLRGSEGLLSGIKYASWPIKVTAWAVLAREFFRDSAARPLPHYFVRFAFVLTAAVLLMQILELLSPSFRGALFDLYPVEAESRLIELTYRARGPFSGYDVTSLFFMVTLVIFNEAKRHPWGLGPILTPLASSGALVGALISARTGFILAVLYLGLSAWLRARPLIRVGMIAGLGVGILGVSVLDQVAGTDESVAGRYAELLAALFAGDITQVQSVYGTFYMNVVVFAGSWNPIWGAGLVSETTADQLYAKYLYMFGIVGLAVWCSLHGAVIVAARRARNNAVPEQAYFARCAWVVAWLFVLAHIKGGNYFFASRLGELVLLVTLLAFSQAGRIAIAWGAPRARE